MKTLIESFWYVITCGVLAFVTIVILVVFALLTPVWWLIDWSARRSVVVLLALMALDAGAVIQNKVLLLTPNGAVSYDLWALYPGESAHRLVDNFTGNAYSISGPHPDGTEFFIKSRHLLDNGQCCRQSDFAYVVSPPSPQFSGTNIISFAPEPVSPDRWIAVSQDGVRFTEWFKYQHTTNQMIILEHKASAMLPVFFYSYGDPPVNPVVPQVKIPFTNLTVRRLIPGQGTNASRP